jgi:hypothetical protein
MASSTQHIAARNDADLLDRFIAIAEKAGIRDAASWVQPRMGKLVRQDVSNGETIADVHATADTTRKAYTEATPPRPGADLTAVTDALLDAAIREVQQEEAPVE